MLNLFVSRNRYDRLRDQLAKMRLEEDILESQLLEAEELVRELQAQVDILMKRERIRNG